VMAQDDLDLTPEERHARDAVRALPPAPATPDADFRARLRAGFVAGTLDSTSTRSAQAPAARVLRGPWFARPAAWAPVAAAAAIAIVLAVGARGPDWEVSAVDGVGEVRIDGVARSGDALTRAIRRGGRVQLDDGVTLDLVAAGEVAVHFAEGSDVQMTAAPARWFDRRAELRVEQGEVYVSTGREFGGARLAVITPEARAEVLGTSFAVMRFGTGTCVCVLEGRVRVGSMFDSTSAEVVQGQRRFCYPSQPAYTDSILDQSVHALHRVHEVSGERLRR